MVQHEMSKSQRELLLRQQMRTIRRELGESGNEDEELELLRERLSKAEPPPDADKAARRELSRMMKIRRVPELRFKYDDSVDKGERIEQLLRAERERGSSGE